MSRILTIIPILCCHILIRGFCCFYQPMMRALAIVLLCIKCSHCLVDPISIGVGVGLGAVAYNFDKVKELTYCKFAECCNDDYIPDDIQGLAKDLNSNLFGQHIVIDQLIPALRSHIYHGSESRKPLVISFHGTPGTGKNYVADFIAKHLYKRGLESNYVHKFVGRSDFPLESRVWEYKVLLKDKIKNAVQACSRSLFIFDEVDKMPPGVFESLTSLLDHHSHLHGVNYRRAIFIFLSNTAGFEIAEHLGHLMEKGHWRETTRLPDFEDILELAAYNLEGGLRRAGIIESHLIDHFIPFLPLEKKHVAECIRAEYKRLGKIPSEESVEKIIENYVTFDKYTTLFSTSGCKRLSKKVEVDSYM